MSRLDPWYRAPVTKKPKKKCPPGTKRNATSGACIANISAPASRNVNVFANASECPPCKPTHTCNRSTGRCVLKTGAIGKKLVQARKALATANAKINANVFANASECPPCPATKVCNRSTGRCVLKPKAPSGARKQCPSCKATQVCNPGSGRCVLKTGAIGKRILAAAA